MILGNDKKNIYDNFRNKVINQDKVSHFRNEKGIDAPKISSSEEVFKDKSPKFLVITTVTLLIIVVIFSANYFFRSNDYEENKFNTYKNLITELDSLNQSIFIKHNKLDKLVKELRNNNEYKNINLSKSENYLLTKPEKEFLKNQVNSEKGSEVKNMINTILQKNSEIEILSDQISELKQRLRPPVIMKKEKSHKQIALDFLTKEIKLDYNEALKKIQNVNIFDYTAPGLYVWNYYNNGFYGTFVTKGKSLKTPAEIKEIARKAFTEKFNKNKEYLNKSLTDLQKTTREKFTLESKLEKNESELIARNENIESLKNQIHNLRIANDSLKQIVSEEKSKIKDLNSVYYNLLSLEQAKKEGFIKESLFSKSYNFKRISYPHSLDLDKKNTLSLEASRFKLTSIKDVEIYPSYYLENNDIKISIKNNILYVNFINIKKLKSDEILIIAN